MPERFESDVKDVSALAQPLKFEFSGRSASNRFLKAAMTERLSSWDGYDKTKRGVPSKNLINVYRRWGEGGTGHILSGNIMVDYDQLEAPGNPIIPIDAPFEGERFEAFREMATQAKAHGSLITGQVSHPGRQVTANVNSDPISASDIQLGDVMGMTFAKPHAASQEEIDHIVKQFAHAAEYLYKAGYDGIELHGAHGYLIAQFLARTTNKRTDKYGGSIENRARLIVEIAQAIRTRLPAKSGFIIGIKLNSVEFQEGGLTSEEAKQVCQILEQNEFDFVELSGGTYQSLSFQHTRESTRKREAFFLEFAEMITPSLNKTKTYITGGFRSVGAMLAALETVDGIGLGRPAAQEFHFVKDVLEGKITGAIYPQIDHDNFGLGNVIAGTQMRQVGNDQEPIDMSKKENVDIFLKDMTKWQAKMGSGDPNNYGFVDLESFKAQPYIVT